MKRYIHTIDIVFVLVLFCVFAISLLFVLMAGAKSYNDIKDSMETQYSECTCIQYLAAKIRHYDEAGTVSLGSFDGMDALCLSENIGGDEYVTYIYYSNGNVMELFTEPSAGLSADAGQIVLPAAGLVFLEAADNLIQISCTGEHGGESNLYISLRSGTVEA